MVVSKNDKCNLPRQARDKHGKGTQKREWRFFAGGGDAAPRLLLFVAGSDMNGFELASTLVPLQSVGTTMT